MSHLENLRPPATARDCLLTSLSVFALGWQGFSADFFEIMALMVASNVLFHDCARSVRRKSPEPSAPDAVCAKHPHLHAERARSRGSLLRML